MTARGIDAGLEFAKATVNTARGGTWKNMTASGLVTGNSGVLLGFFVNSTNVGTLILCDSNNQTVPMGGVITPAAGNFYTYPALFLSGLSVTIGGTALDVTFFYLAKF